MPRPPASSIRSLLLRLVIAVVVLHGTAIALHSALGIATADERARNAFLIAWVVATLVVCSYYLRRIRLLRRGLTVRGRRR